MFAMGPTGGSGENRRDAKAPLPIPQKVDSVVMFVMDLTGGSGEKSSIQAQLDVRDELKQRFPDHLWIDVMSKADLPRCVSKTRRGEWPRLRLWKRR